jgi:hypothetical protein
LLKAKQTTAAKYTAIYKNVLAKRPAIPAIVTLYQKEGTSGVESALVSCSEFYPGLNF